MPFTFTLCPSLRPLVSALHSVPLKYIMPSFTTPCPLSSKKSSLLFLLIKKRFKGALIVKKKITAKSAEITAQIAMLSSIKSEQIALIPSAKAMRKQLKSKNASSIIKKPAQASQKVLISYFALLCAFFVFSFFWA